MEENYFDHNYQVHFYETNPYGELGIINLVNYFEEVALLQSENLGVGLSYLREKNVVWLLHRWEINIFKYPIFGQQVVVRTLPYSISGFTGYRKFFLFGDGNVLMAEANSAWIFMNTLTKRPCRVSEDMKRAYGHLGKAEKKMDLAAIRFPGNPLHKKQFEVQFSDIDLNKHSNNTRYLHWAIETLPWTFLEEHSLVNVNVEYRKEITLGQVVTSEAGVISENGSTCCHHRISNCNGIDSAILLTRWIPRE